MTTASVKERKEIFEELRQCIKGRGEIFSSVGFLHISLSSIHCNQLDLSLPQISPSELPEPAIRGLCKLFCLTPHRYRWVWGFIHKQFDPWRSEAGRMTDTQTADFRMKVEFPCREACVCSLGMPHHAERSSLLLASWLRLSLRS